jgi:hypothetical protein
MYVAKGDKSATMGYYTEPLGSAVAYEARSVAVQFGNCAEPSNVKGNCPGYGRTTRASNGGLPRPRTSSRRARVSEA